MRALVVSLATWTAGLEVIAQSSPAAQPAAGGPAGATGLLDLGSGPAQRATITLEADLMPEPAEGVEDRLRRWGTSPMLDRLRGVLVDLRGSDLRRLRGAFPPSPRVGDAADAQRVATIHLFASPDDPKAGRRVDVLRRGAGQFVGLELDAQHPRRIELDFAAFSELWSTLPVYRGGFESEPLARAQTLPLDVPIAAGRVFLDAATFSSRFAGGAALSIDPALRSLHEERMVVRLPRDYDPARAHAAVVWIDPTAEAVVPAALHAALDELGMVAIAPARAGNARQIADRYQLALDAAQTAVERFNVDAGRVYVAGFSGGGRVASALVVCVPEVFAGAVAIGGVSCFEPVPTGTGRFWPAGFARPSPTRLELARGRRLAAITGSGDFNQREVVNALDLYRRARLPHRLWDVRGLGHELPAPAVILDALGWVDEPNALRARRAEVEAARLVEQARGSRDPEAAGRLLVRATQVGPWTAAAWEASRLVLRAEAAGSTRGPSGDGGPGAKPSRGSPATPPR